MKLQQRRRGFALVIVLLIGFVAAAIATAVLSSSAATAVGAGHSAEAELARTLALSGMERATAYAFPMEDVSGDYDMLIDPDGIADCSTNPPTCAATGAEAPCNVPEYTDGDVVTYNGKKYQRVAYNGGAYLTRFDDDADDMIVDSSVTTLWSPQTNNHNTTGGCDEGSTLGYDNPFRDRNRTVLVTVIGIAPGTDPATAKHRVVYRQTMTIRTSPAVVGIEVGHNIDAGSGSSRVYMCAPNGTVGVNNDVNGSSASSSCYCGDARAKNTPAWKNCDAGNVAASGCDGAGLCAVGVATKPGQPAAEQKMLPDVTTTSITSSPARSEFAFNATRPCNFWVATSGGSNVPPALGATTKLVVWFWDANAARGPSGGLCLDLPATSAIPAPLSGLPYADCWLPIVIGNAASPLVCVDALSQGEVDADCTWKPRAGVRTIASAASFNNGGIAPIALPAGMVFPYTLPNWETECLIDFPSQAAKNCTQVPTDVTMGSCDGLSTAMSWYETSGVYFFGPEKLGAVVPGAYYFGTDLTLTTTEQFSGTLTKPGVGVSPLDLSLFPKATIVVDGKLNVTGNYWFGVGEMKGSGAARSPPTDSPRAPSLIVREDLKLNSGVVRVAGSIWVGNNFEWKATNAHTLDGELHVKNDAKFDNGIFNWNYKAPLQDTSATSLLDLVTAPVRAPSNE